MCKAFSFGTIEYSWERENDTLPTKSSTDICSTTLSIPNATQFDEGNYCCVATNECGSVKQCALLSIIGMLETCVSIYTVYWESSAEENFRGFRESVSNRECFLSLFSWTSVTKMLILLIIRTKFFT